VSNASASRLRKRDSCELEKLCALPPAPSRAMPRPPPSISCGLHRPPHDLLRLACRHCGFAAVLILASVFPAAAEESAATPWFAPFSVMPLAPPLTVTGSFGERRPRHFHAGLDLSTGAAVGRPVRAPIDGWIERIRTQGYGYGRSIYLHGSDGRLVVLAHLDAFTEPIAAYVAGVQDSTQRYEQDLWPPRQRFAVRAGDPIAWSGRSGTVVPHLHVEVRHGDMAFNPLLAGLPVRVPLSPQIRGITLEPLDGSSWVERGAGALTLSLALERPETLLVEGRVRAMLRADQPGERGARLSPWRLRETWNSDWIEWNADSASWATDMSDVDYVYDVGRSTSSGAPAIQMWAPARWRPRVLRTSTSDSLEAGMIEVHAGDPPRPLRLEIRDVLGRSSQRVLWLRGPRQAERGPAPHGTGRFERAPTRRRGASPHPAPVARWFELTALPDEALRLSFKGAPSDLRDVTLADRPATRRDGVWSAVFGGGELGASLSRTIRGRRASGSAWADSAPAVELHRVGATGGHGETGGSRWRLDRESVFEPATIVSAAAARPAEGGRELVPIGDAIELGPASLPLRTPALVRLSADPSWKERAGAYGDFGSGWEWVGGAASGDPAAVAGESRRLGRFAAFADTMAPRAVLLHVARHRAPGPYSTWSLKARVIEEGSGVEGRESFFRVDGQRVPCEWDEPRDLLIWRPLAPPSAGTHAYEIEVRDHAGNVRRLSGVFVLD